KKRTPGLPESFLNKLSRIFSPNMLGRVLKTLESKNPTTFRINSLKISRSQALQEFKRLNIVTRNVEWFQDAFVLIRPDLNELSKTELYIKGRIYVQNLSSMVPPLALSLKESDSVLDLTAAPGSKTTQMAALMHNAGEIIAFEKDSVRYQKLLANLRYQGVLNTEAHNIDSLGAWRDYFERFDKVLLDAPCTAEGRFHTARPKTYRYWNQVKVKNMAKKQKGLIRAAFSCLKPGGLLVYSTCTFSPEENESVVNYLLKKFPDCCFVEPIKINLKSTMPGLTSWSGVSFNPSLKNCIRIIPDGIMEGFFVALIRKTDS
ncbi:MAG: RsmB/NOP family class I SAM-dependent RNA methyltransferase, partial [Candidatus Omnitrophica bacterium]|nr:RsmB/NOP family class I SAM-dependent RNA methyltransferase [Candidatus Omnitrophota bacterium]